MPGSYNSVRKLLLLNIILYFGIVRMSIHWAQLVWDSRFGNISHVRSTN